MKEKVENGIVPARQTVTEENNYLKEHPLYSVGEDFYRIYQEDKDIEPRSNPAN